MAYVLAAAGTLEVHTSSNNNTATYTAHTIALAKQYLTSARTAFRDKSTSTNDDEKLKVYMHLQEFHLAVKQGDGAAQLAFIHAASEMESFSADNLLIMANLCSEDITSGEACRAALQAALQKLLNNKSKTETDYSAVSQVLRELAKQPTATTTDILHIVSQVGGIVAAAPQGVYPVVELQWMVTFAWNQGLRIIGSTHKNDNSGSGSREEAEQLMKAALELAKVGGGDGGFVLSIKNVEMMESKLAELEV